MDNEEARRIQKGRGGDSKAKTKDFGVLVQNVIRGYRAYIGEFLVSWAPLKIYDF